VFCCAAVEHLSDVRMIHHRERLALGFEARHDLLGVHPELDDLERDLALDGCRLLRHPNSAHATLADGLQELVPADHVAFAFAGQRLRELDAGAIRLRACSSCEVRQVAVRTWVELRSFS
jgi:hypothetical protein